MRTKRRTVTSIATWLLLLALVGAAVPTPGWEAVGATEVVARPGSKGTNARDGAGPPETTIEDKPAARTNNTDAAFTYTSSTSKASFECALDQERFKPCEESGQSYGGLQPGRHAFKVRAVDAAGNADPTPDRHEWTVGTAKPVPTTTPQAPVKAPEEDGAPAREDDAPAPGQEEDEKSQGDVDPPKTTISDQPAARSDKTEATFSYAASEPNSTFACALDGGGFRPCDPAGQSYRGLRKGEHLFAVRATDSAGNADETPAKYTWTVVAVKPEPPGESAGETQERPDEGTNGEPDGGAAKPPSENPDEAAELPFADGFESGDLSRWTVKKGLQVEAKEGAAGEQVAHGRSTGNPAFAVTALNPPQGELYYRVKFELRDRGKNPVTLLAVRTADGEPLVSLQVDGAGRLGYRNAVTKSTVTSAVVVTEGVWHEVELHARSGKSGQIEVWYDGQRVDKLSRGQALGAKKIGKVVLGDAARGRTFNVAFDDVAVDSRFVPLAIERDLDTPADPVDADPGGSNPEVDVTPPETTIKETPKKRLDAAAANFSYASSEAGATFSCALDGADFQPCDADGRTYDELAAGEHTFAVRATDEAGNTDPEPAGFAWTIAPVDAEPPSGEPTPDAPADNAAPETTLEDGPLDRSARTRAAFIFSSDDAVATFECQIDDTAYAACYSPASYDGLTEGAHTFRVRAVDAAGNADDTPASYAWTISAAPTVGAVVPNARAKGVDPAVVVEITFAEAMDPSTLTADTVTLASKGGADPIEATVTYDASTKQAILAPEGDLAPATTYTATVEGGSNGALDADGTPLASDETWSFTTAALDETPPTVVVVGPADGAADVPLGATIEATFTEAMDPATLKPETFTVQPQGGAVIAAQVRVNAAGTTATLDPDAKLNAGTTYTATVEGGATDAAGNPLAGDHAWSFTTAAQADATAPETGIAFGAQADARVAQGYPSQNYGARPRLIIDGKSPVQSYLRFVVSGVDGTVTRASLQLYVSEGTVNGPAVFPADNTWNEGRITWNNRPRRTSGMAADDKGAVPVNTWAEFDVTSLVAGDGTYTFNLTQTSANAVSFISKEAADSSLRPRLVLTVDTTPPTVGTMTPPHEAIEVLIDSNVEATFGEPMDPASLTARTFTLAPPGGPAVAALVRYNEATQTATLDPETELDFGTTYTATVTTGAKDAADNSLATEQAWAFTTAAPPDTTAPETALDDGPDDPTNGTTATFAFSANEVGTSIECALDAETFAACVSPAEYSGLGDGAHRFQARARDAAGNVDATPAEYTWTVDTTPPTVTGIGPADGATGVAPSANVAAIFSEEMHAATISPSTFTLVPQSGGAAVAAVVTYNASAQKAVLNPGADLASGTSYTATVTTGATDLTGNPLAADKVWSFTTDGAGTLTFAADADAEVRNDFPSSNYGASNALTTDGSPIVESYLRFAVNGVGGTVTGATLRLYAYNGTGNGPAVYPIENTWDEAAVTWDTKPTRTGSATDDLGAIGIDTWAEFDVTPLLAAGNGTYSVSLVSLSADAAIFYSKEQTTNASLRPQLMLTVQDGGSSIETAITPPIPPAMTNGVKATFAFAASQLDADFECLIDGGAWEGCVSPTTYSGLAEGNHAFQVRAVDAADNADPTPARHEWTVDTMAPTATGVAPGDGATDTAASATVTATFSEAMDPDTLTAGTFTLAAQDGSPIAAVVTYDAATNTAVLNPEADLELGTTYAAAVTGGVIGAKDLAGNPLAADHAWSFVTASPAPDPVLLVAGDIASCASSGDEQTAALLDGLDGTVATLGDNAYESGTAAEFRDCYDPTWGQHKARTRPAVGNHEYHTAGAAGYFGYFGATAGDPNKGYYSYDLGEWHVAVLNSMCDEVGGCGPGSPQEQWLRADLAAHPNDCTLAYWHHPRFSSGAEHGSSADVQPLWQVLYDAGAEVLLAGHEHHYERFAPMDAAGNPDMARGIREFVVGTGGNTRYGFGTILSNSETHQGDSLGILKLTLRPSGYDWEFVPVAGARFTDTGSGECHDPPPTRTFGAEADAWVEPALPTANYGGEGQLTVDNSPQSEAYLRFTVSGVNGPVTSATLRLYNTDGTRNGPVVYRAENTWTEMGVTWNTKPDRTRFAAKNEGGVVAYSWVEYDLTAAVTGDGTFTFNLVGDSSDGSSFSSREATAIQRPQLVVTSDPTALTVSASPSGGDYASIQTVTLTASEPSTIYYTTDGSDPTTSHTRHTSTGSLAIPGSRTIKFYAVTSDNRTSAVRVEAYKINVTAGYRDFYYGGTGVAEPTADKTESKLWFHDGSWWGSLYSNSTGEYRIHRFAPASQTWVDTGTTIDVREDSRADVLWDGIKLYVASGTTVVSEWGGPPTEAQLAAGSAELLRLSYDPETQMYNRDPGFPVTIRSGSSESMTLAKDSTGQLWITFTRNGQVWVNRSLGSDTDWGTPFVPAVAGTRIHYDDISAIVAFGGDKVGLMWSNQNDRKFYFAVHRDADPDDVWQVTETAHGGGVHCSGGCANDHLNLTTDAAGRVFAAIKTAHRTTGNPLVQLLVRDPSGRWNAHTFGRVEDEHSRPRVLIDEEHGRLYLLATIPELGQAIFYKSTCLNQIAFEPGPGNPLIQNEADRRLNNATSTKQNLNGATGLLVLAGDSTSKFYSHNYLSLNAASPCS